jgi:hypothetical protein
VFRQPAILLPMLALGCGDASRVVDIERDAAIPDALQELPEIADGGAEASCTGPELFVDSYDGLVEALADACDAATIHIAAGRYEAMPQPVVDPICGNCQTRVDIPGTVGFHIRDKAVHLVGESRGDTVLVTRAGYGVLFENAGRSSVANLTVTGGVRDADGDATNGGIVVRHTELLVEHVDIVRNDHLRDDLVVGIAGIVGRDGATLTVRACNILDNSWDGIALYRSDPTIPGSQPRATILSNRIGCTRSCIEPHGRGAGIGITWDAEAIVVGNRIFRHWKGIGTFGESHAVVRNNIVEDQIAWGIIAAGSSHLIAENNVSARNGSSGLAVWSTTATGRFANNIVVGNGWRTYRPIGERTGVWVNAQDRFEIAHNDVFDNRPIDACAGGLREGEPCLPHVLDGVDGNLAVDPRFTRAGSYDLKATSPLIDAGDPELRDRDGSRSDVGLHGGPLGSGTPPLTPRASGPFPNRHR